MDEMMGYLEEDERDEVDSIQGTVTALLQDARAHFTDDREDDLTQATEYYWAEPFGDEKKNRSKVVSSDVRDAVMDIMPSIMRIFFGGERPMEYVPEELSDEPLAKMITEYITSVVIQKDNRGFVEFSSAFKDALIRRLGGFKWWWEEKARKVEEDLYDVSEQQLVMYLLQDQDIEFDISAEKPQPDGSILYDIHVWRMEHKGYSAFMALPPEEILFTEGARSLEDAQVVAHSREVPVDTLYALGYTEDEIEEHIGRTAPEDDEGLPAVRGPVWGDENEESRDKSQAPILFTEAYVLIDADGDGIGERRLFHCVGEDYTIIGPDEDKIGDAVGEIPITLGPMDIEPHNIEGPSIWDLLKDIQRIKSHIQRGMLDSLAKSLNSDMEVVQGMVNMADVLSPDVSKVIRVRAPGQLRDMTHPFIGEAALPVLGYFDQAKEDRSGSSRAAKGLDADALQSSTKAAVTATFTKSQERVELIARTFAETMVKDLFRGLLKLEVKHQNRARKVRLLGHYVEVDPRSWNADMDIQINVGLGKGTPADRLAVLEMIIAKQEQALQFGLPIVSMVEYRQALAKWVELGGLDFADVFFKPWGPQEEQQHQQMKAQQPPQPDPNMALVKVEEMKAQMKAQADMMKLELDKMKALMEDDRERDRMAREMVLKEREIEMKHQAEINDAQLKAQVARERASMDADIKAQQASQQNTGGGA